MRALKNRKKKPSGLKLAIAYGLAPNQFGFCGPQGRENRRKLRDYLKNKISDREIKAVLKKFEAAFAYLKLIAEKNNIADPFDYKVVEAFWVGNKLLDKVNSHDLKKMVMDKFTRPGLLSNNQAKERLKLIPKNSRPHHSFHVYIFGTITGRVSLEEARMKDLCRVGWGRVKKIVRAKNNSKIIVECQPIIKNKKFTFGRFRMKEIKWDKTIVPEVKLGDWVSFHWNCLAQTLSNRQADNLEKYTRNTLKLL